MVFGNRNPYKTSVGKQKFTSISAWFRPLIFATLAFVCVLVLFLFGIPAIMKWRVEEETQFKNGTETWRKLTNITVPVFFHVMVFNITNPDEASNGEKIRLEELGPYVYEEKRIKTVTNVNLEEDTVTYFETTTFTFRPDLSNGTEDDRVSAINFPFVAAATVAKKYVYGFSNILIRSLEGLGEGIVRKNITVRELIFMGMDIHPLYATLGDYFSPGGSPAQFVGDTFAYLNGRNASHTGEFKVRSGINDSSQFGKIVTWNGKKELDFWTDDSLPEDQQYCNKFNGSDGSIHPPFMTKDRRLYAYYPLICRSLNFEFSRETNFAGIPAWEFKLPRDIFASPERNPDNTCFCINPGGGLNSECVDGVYRAFTCKNDSPFVFSKPHFLDGDKKLVEGVEGLHPDRALHDSKMEFEPFSAMVLTANVKLQLVVELQPLESVTAFQNIPHAFVPFIWVEQVAYLGQGDIDFLMNTLVIPLQVITVIKWISIVSSALVLLVTIFHTARRYSSNDRVANVRSVELEPIKSIQLVLPNSDGINL